jgi:hypothetical protein
LQGTVVCGSLAALELKLNNTANGLGKFVQILNQYARSNINIGI